ncbi:nucleotide phosphatase [Lithospermum erythrorhizon]|uniref:Nucleotide phosphatase n=1 Tax=Lithospermum erythrorhizon TaxID=34254 RepID=A0AAV3NZU1_LITER
MVLGRIADVIAAATARFSTSSSSSAPHAPGLPPLPVAHHISNFSTSGPNNILRPSSSLQDFSAYRRLSSVESDVNSEFLRKANVEQQPFLQRENAGSSFSKEKSSPGNPKQRKWMRVILIIFCLILVAALMYALQFIYFSWSKEIPKYYVVLDCGSTGTRVYVYQASANHQKDNSLPISVKSFPEDPESKSRAKSGRAYNRMETEPGFDKLVHNISGIRGAIKPLVQWAKKQIPKNAYKSTSLFLYATAGLRRLPSEDSEWVLDNAWSILKNSPFLCKREWVKIINGMEEAYFGWIALNYHSGTLGTILNRKTFGALDLGGSSLQVTFESKTEISDETSLQLSIGPVNHHLSAYSLSGYGLNDAFEKSVVYLVKKLHQMTDADLLSGKVEVKHPCLQSGYNEEYICSHCTSALQEGGSPPAEGNKWGKGGKEKVTILLTGAPKWDECRALARVAVNLSEWSSQSPAMDCELQPCALPNHLPHPYGNFYAMSGFFVVYRFFNLTPEAALDDVLEKGQQFCDKTWDIAKNSVAPQPFIEQYCFRAPYVVFLLREGLHIPDSFVAIGSGSITWTLGVALLEAGKTVPTTMVFQSYERLKMKIHPIILFGILFLSLFVLLYALFCVGNAASKYFRRPYLPLFRHNSPSSASIMNIPAPFRFQRWSPIIPGDGRVKLPLSPRIANTHPTPFDDTGIQLTESPLYRTSGFSHSLSSDSLSHMQFENSPIGSLWTPHRGMRLQSRRSQSREELHSSVAEAHMDKV